MRLPATSLSNSLGLNIQLLYRPLGLVSAVAHRISDEVMHVDTGAVVLDHLSEVEITFPQRRRDRTIYHRVIAHVGKRSAEGTLLRFVRCNRDAHQALRELMSGTTPLLAARCAAE